MKFDCGWYVLYVKSCWEKKVHESLKEISLESFLPQVKTVKQWSDRKKVTMKPLFPSYVFVYINSSLGFHKALSVNGAFSYIRFGKEYARVQEKEINQIKLLTGDESIEGIEITSHRPKVGEIKKITYGPLKGLSCEIIKAYNHKKIIVRIDSLQQNIMATIPLCVLEE
ncbi:UpxY family transcription antiterminator [Tenacibaculum singaporense]|uniref:UpxY family transcription antiterminator n=2 Tax=Tenacibaculum singaporense TaxID=2358479 RepID=A0A3S8R647_9FLAO|nr:UpxY family transcription antiterminator [Tenacibaculum singaporense]RSC93589.1 UpxY family transcription antiterminator [Tenacibaculum singaporense]